MKHAARASPKAGNTKGSGQPSNGLETFGQTTVEVKWERLHGCKFVRGAELVGDGSGQIRLAANL